MLDYNRPNNDKQMTQETIRLSRIAKELNIGKDTLVECLKLHGHEVDSNPNTKITLDQYELLRKEYATEAEIPAEAKTMNSKDEDNPISQVHCGFQIFG